MEAAPRAQPRRVSAVAARTPQAPETDVGARARFLQARFGAAAAADILAASIEAFRGRIALVSSFGAESAALLDLVASVDRRVPVIFIDTGKHFLQTLAYRKELARRLGLEDVRDVAPDAEERTREDARGDLWRRDVDACCTLRKVRPLARALAGFEAWISGRKQFHGGLRAALPAFEASAPFVKVNPLIRWSADDLRDYAERRSLPAHPLVADGYLSVGCWPCTHPVALGEGPRDGRWRGAAKTECGIHAAGAVKDQSAA